MGLLVGFCFGALALAISVVAAALLLGSPPLFVGLAVVMPVLGHATRRFHRKGVERTIVDDPEKDLDIDVNEVTNLRRYQGRPHRIFETVSDADRASL